MKTTPFILVVIVITLSFMSCSNRSELLQQAESVMQQKPDSALQILNSIQSPENLKDKELADYCLLLTQARDKNYIEHESDSLINIAITYYENTNDNEKKALSYFYKGRYYYDKEDYINATTYYKRAEDFGARTKNLELTGLIYNNLGHVNRKQRLTNKSLYYFKKALFCAKSIGNSSRIISNSQEVAKAFTFMNQPDSADYYFMQSVQLINSVDSSMHAFAYHNIGAFYQDNGQLDKSLFFLQKALELGPDDEDKYRTYALIADVYSDLGDLDNAENYWNLSLQSDNVYTKQYIYLSLFRKSVRENDQYNTVQFANKYIAYSDSINMKKSAKDILEIQEKYDNESLTRKKVQYELYVFQLIMIVCILATVLMICIWHFKKNKAVQHKKFREALEVKEMILNDYKIQLSELTDKIVVEEKEKREQTSLLNDKIKKYENEISELKDRYGLKTTYSESDKYDSIYKGMVLCHKLTAQNKLLKLKQQDFPHIIRFYGMYDKAFMTSLMRDKYHLTTLDRIICILFRLRLTHQQISFILGNTSETLTRSKTRIKKEKFGIADERKLEEILFSNEL